MSNNYECPNCGNILANTDMRCKYCGTKNPNFVPLQKDSSSSNVNKLTVPKQGSGNTQSAPQQPKKKEMTGTDWTIFILLLIFFWPAAIVYIVVKG